MALWPKLSNMHHVRLASLPDLQSLTPHTAFKHKCDPSPRTLSSLSPPATMLRSISTRILSRRSLTTARRYSTPNASSAYSEARGHLPHSQSPITSKLHFFNSVTEEGKQIPTYRVLDGVGQVLEGAEVPEVRTPR